MTTMEYEARRDKIMDGLFQRNYGDIKYFTGLTAKKLQQLVDEKFADLEESQNSSPTIKEFLNFMRSNPGFRAHGYVITSEREDRRVTIEGVEWFGPPKKIPAKKILNFTNLFRHADEFIIDETTAYCWFD